MEFKNITNYIKIKIRLNKKCLNNGLFYVHFNNKVKIVEHQNVEFFCENLDANEALKLIDLNEIDELIINRPYEYNSIQ